MKKILFATTALAAVSLASFANAQESNMMSAGGNTLNIGGYYEFGWASRSDDAQTSATDTAAPVDQGGDTRMYGESELFIDFETSNSGMTYGVQIDLEVVNGNSTGEAGDAKNAEESNIYISGDFGRVNLGHDDFASDSFLIWAPTHEGATSQDDSVYGLRYTAETDDAGKLVTPVNLRYFGNAASYNDQAKVTYLSPSFSGFKFGVSVADGAAGDEEYDTGFGASYGTNLGGIGRDASIKVAYAYFANGESTKAADADAGTVATTEKQDSSLGVSLSMDKITLTGSLYNGDDGDIEKTTTEFGAGYNFGNNFSVGWGYATAEADQGTGATAVKEEGTFHSLSASYGIAPGLKTTVAYNLSDLTRTAGTEKVSNDISEIVWQVEFSF